MTAYFRLVDEKAIVRVEGFDLLEPYVERVELAAQQAESSANAATMAGLAVGVFDSTAAGIAATVDGEYFYVPGSGVIYIYENVSEVATLRHTYAETIIFLPPQTALEGSIALGDGLRLIENTASDYGRFNTSVGMGAMPDLTTGRYNTCVGFWAGRYMTSVGVVTTYSPDPGGAMPGIGNHGNSFFGYLCGAAANGALDNSMFGVKCGLNLRTGMDNSGFGINTLESIDGGSENAFFGHAGFRAVVGWGKIGVDDYDNSLATGGDGHRNTGMGDMAGRLINSTGAEKTKGRCNVYVGARTRSAADYTVNENVFGYRAEGHGTDTISYGNENIDGHYFNAGAVYVVSAPTVAAAGKGPNLYRNPTTGALQTSGAWADYTPTVEPSSGAFTALTINSARYTEHGKTIHVLLDFTVTTKGSASGDLTATLPVAPADIFTLTGRDMASGNAWTACNVTGNSTTYIGQYNGSSLSAISDGSRIILTGVYEAA